MASETEWFFRLFENNVFTQEMRTAWALDSIALGPHKDWIEPEVLREAFEGSTRMERGGVPEVSWSIWTIVWSTTPGNTMNAAAILQGLREVADPFTPVMEDPVLFMAPYEQVLHPLWARSGTRIANAIQSPMDLEYLRLSSMAQGLTPRLYMRAINAEVNEDVAFEFDAMAEYLRFDEAYAGRDYSEDAVELAMDLLYTIREQDLEFATRIEQTIRDLFVVAFRKKILREKGPF